MARPPATRVSPAGRSGPRRFFGRIVGGFLTIVAVISAIAGIRWHVTIPVSVVTATAQLTGAGPQTITAACPDNQQLLNGGYHLDSSTPGATLLTPSSNYPLDAHTWAVQASDPDQASIRLIVTALCIPGDAPAVMIATTSGGTPPQCAAGQVAIGGGYAAQASAVGSVDRSAVNSGDATALGGNWNIDANGAAITTYALCVASTLPVSLGPSTSVTLSQGTTTTPLRCAAGAAPIGLSFGLAPSDGARNVTISQSDADERQWAFATVNEDASAQQATLQVICLQITHTIDLFGLTLPFSLPW